MIYILVRNVATRDLAPTFATAAATEFVAYIEPHLPRMLLLAERLGGNVSRDDIVQEALINAWRKRHQFKQERGSLSSWLMAIVADQARKTSPPDSRYLGGACTSPSPVWMSGWMTR